MIISNFPITEYIYDSYVIIKGYFISLEILAFARKYKMNLWSMVRILYSYRKLNSWFCDKKISIWHCNTYIHSKMCANNVHLNRGNSRIPHVFPYLPKSSWFSQVSFLNPWKKGRWDQLNIKSLISHMIALKGLRKGILEIMNIQKHLGRKKWIFCFKMFMWGTWN